MLDLGLKAWSKLESTIKGNFQQAYSCVRVEPDIISGRYQPVWRGHFRQLFLSLSLDTSLAVNTNLA